LSSYFSFAFKANTVFLFSIKSILQQQKQHQQQQQHQQHHNNIKVEKENKVFYGLLCIVDLGANFTGFFTGRSQGWRDIFLFRGQI